jgi:predicted DNA-binding transcriptional regulator AlpA
MASFPALLTLTQIAAQLGVPVSALYRNMSGLRACGFPRPVAGCGRRYDPEAIAAWLARQRTAPSVPSPLEGEGKGEAPPAAPAADDIPGWQAELDRRLDRAA